MRLNDTVSSGKRYELCDFAPEEDANHIILQCPAYDDPREEIFVHINSGCQRVILECYGYSHADMESVWIA